MPELRLECLSREFVGPCREKISAVQKLDVALGNGELMVLLGPSGSGKTTTLKLIAGLEMPDSGRIFLGGKEITDLPAGQRDISLVFQNPALLPHLSVR